MNNIGNHCQLQSRRACRDVARRVLTVGIGVQFSMFLQAAVETDNLKSEI